MDLAFEWYDNERKKEEALREELRRIRKKEDAVYFVKKCLHQMNYSYTDKNSEKENKIKSYLKLREYVSIIEIKKVISVSINELNNLSFIARGYVETVREVVVPDSQYQVHGSDFLWEDLIYCIIGEHKSL